MATLLVLSGGVEEVDGERLITAGERSAILSQAREHGENMAYAPFWRGRRGLEGLEIKDEGSGLLARRGGRLAWMERTK